MGRLRILTTSSRLSEQPKPKLSSVMKTMRKIRNRLSKGRGSLATTKSNLSIIEGIKQTMMWMVVRWILLNCFCCLGVLNTDKFIIKHSET